MPETDRRTTFSKIADGACCTGRTTSPELVPEELAIEILHGTAREELLVLEAEVEFDADGRLVAVHAEREAAQGKTYVRMPWTGRFRAWRDVGGRAFPTEWESEWRPASGAWTAVRMRVTAVRTE